MITSNNPASAEISQEIRELNLSYMILCQRLLREDFASGLYQTGLDEEAGEVLMSLSPSQLMALSNSATLLVSFRLNDAALLSQLAESHSSILQRAKVAMTLAQASPTSLHSQEA